MKYRVIFHQAGSTGFFTVQFRRFFSWKHVRDGKFVFESYADIWGWEDGVMKFSTLEEAHKFMRYFRGNPSLNDFLRKQHSSEHQIVDRGRTIR